MSAYKVTSFSSSTVMVREDVDNETWIVIDEHGAEFLLTIEEINDLYQLLENVIDETARRKEP